MHTASLALPGGLLLRGTGIIFIRRIGTFFSEMLWKFPVDSKNACLICHFLLLYRLVTAFEPFRQGDFLENATNKLSFLALWRTAPILEKDKTKCRACMLGC